MTEHPLAELSAFADGALAAERSAAVQVHLDGCAECRTRLAELRGVARLVAALPSAVPSRSLVPRVATRPSWLAPLRTLSAIASGAFAFLFIASTMLSLQPPTETSRTAPEGRALFATPVFGPISSIATAGPVGPAGSAAGAAVPAAIPAPNQKSDVVGAAPSITTDARTAASPAPSSTATGPGPVVALSRQPAPSGPSAAVWLALALVFAAIAIALQRRLRRG